MAVRIISSSCFSRKLISYFIWLVYKMVNIGIIGGVMNIKNVNEIGMKYLCVLHCFCAAERRSPTQHQLCGCSGKFEFALRFISWSQGGSSVTVAEWYWHWYQEYKRWICLFSVYFSHVGMFAYVNRIYLKLGRICLLLVCWSYLFFDKSAYIIVQFLMYAVDRSAVGY